MAAVRAAIVEPKSQRNVVVGMPRALLEEAEKGSHGVLSARELEILLLAARGLSDRQIGGRLCTSRWGPSSATWPTPTRRWGWARGQATRMALYEEWIAVQDVTDDLDETEGE